MQWLKRIFTNKPPSTGRKNAVEIPPAKTAAMLQMLQMTQEIELTCDEVQALLAEYTEMAMRGEDTGAVLPLVHRHLDMCPDCREEYEALLRILQSQEK